MRGGLRSYKNRSDLLDTLAQNGTPKGINSIHKDLIIVTGNGTEIKNIKGLKGWAKRKLITQKMMLALIDVAKEKGKTDHNKAYWNTYHCLSHAYSSNGLLYGKYCKNRFCTLCLCIRKAEIVNKYLPVLKEWTEPYLVTLTIRSVPHWRLTIIFNKMIQGFQRIKDKYRKRNQRKGVKNLIGIKSLECNFNPKRKSYNPHFHLIVPDKETAEIFITEWCKLWTRKWTSLAAQDKRLVTNLAKGLIECVKYGTKIFTEPDVNKKARQKGISHIYVSALDNILRAMKGHRLFDRFGFNLPTPSLDTGKFTPLNHYDEWIFDVSNSDWVNPETAEMLSGYNPNHELILLLKNNIDLELQ